MEQQVLGNTFIPDDVEYIPEVEIKEIHEFELDIAVQYFMEFAKQETLCTNNTNWSGTKGFCQ